MGFRFMEWPRVVMIVAPFVLLLGYVVWVYLLVRGRSFAAVLLRLVAATSVFTGLWTISAFVLSFRANTSSMRLATFNGSIGLPYSLFREALWHLEDSGWPAFLVRALPVALPLLLVGGTVAITQRRLAKSRYAIEQHGWVYVRALSGIAAGALTILLWPQPARNPDMPYVPIPDDAVEVTYTTTDEHRWPLTTFSANTGIGYLLGYYQETLQADGWTLEYSEAAFPGNGHGSGKALFSLDGEVLELKLGSFNKTHIQIVKRQVTPAELAELAALPKPTATPTRYPAPPPPPPPSPVPTTVRLQVLPVPSHYTLPVVPTVPARVR
jgi:hypothetical protein